MQKKEENYALGSWEIKIIKLFLGISLLREISNS